MSPNKRIFLVAMDERERKRISAKISAMSFLCALFVVLIHTRACDESGWIGYFVNFFNHGLCTIAVPFFFSVSGYFLMGHYGEDGWWQIAVVKRMKTLLIPFFIWNFLYFIFCNLLAVIQNIFHEIPVLQGVNLSSGALLKVIGMYPFSEPYLGPLWYVRGLLLFVFLSPLLLAAVRRFGLFVVVVPWIVGYFTQPELSTDASKWQLLFRFMCPIMSLSYFLLGAYLRINGMSFRPLNRRIIIVVSLVIAVVFAALFACNRVGDFWRLGGLIKFRFFMEPFFLFAVWGLMPAIELPRLCVGAAFPIYLMHKFVLTFMTVFMIWMPMGVKFILGALIPILVAMILRRFVPNVAYCVFGGR